MAGYISNSPRRPVPGALADLLASGKQYGNRYEVKDWVPLIGGTGLGDIFMGQAPELVNDVSYNGLPALVRGGNVATGGIGTLAPDKRTFDAAMLGLDAVGLAKLSGAAGKTGLRKLFSYSDDTPVSESRREFLKKGAALGGAAAVGLPLLYAGRKTAKETVEPIAKVVEPPKHKYNSLSEYRDALYRRAENQASMGRSLGYRNAGDTGDFMKMLGNQDAAEYARQKRLKPAADEAILEAFSPQAKAEMKAFKKAAKDYRAWAPGESFDSAVKRGYALEDSVPSPWNVLDDYLADPNYFANRATKYKNSFNTMGYDEVPY